MNKTEQLLKMLERPEQYTERQWQDILADDECRELYSLMAKTRSALALMRSGNAWQGSSMSGPSLCPCGARLPQPLW